MAIKPPAMQPAACTPLGITYISGAGTAGADNTAQVVKTLVLAAGTLSQVGDRVRIRIYWTGDTGNPITGTAALNGVTICTHVDGGAATLQVCEAWLHYIDATHANIIAMNDGLLTTPPSGVNIAGFDWANAQNITASQNLIVNNHIVVYAMIVDVYPKGA